MFFEQQGEQKNAQIERKIQELQTRMENLDREISEFLKSLNVTEEQISFFINNKENFTEENWSTITQQKILFEQKLDCELQNIRDPIKTKKARSSLHVKRHWLHVR